MPLCLLVVFFLFLPNGSSDLKAIVFFLFLANGSSDLKANGAGPSVINNQETQQRMIAGTIEHNSFGGHPNIIDAHASWPSNIMQPMTPGVISANYSLPSQPSIINADAAGTSNLNQQQRQMLMDMDTGIISFFTKFKCVLYLCFICLRIYNYVLYVYN